MQQKQQQAELQLLQTQPVDYKQFSVHFPAVQISSKHYSLDADIATGWKPKVRILGPIPLNFDYKLVDQIVDELTSFGRKYKQRVIYLGYRYESSFKMHQQMKRNYTFKYQGVINSNYLHMAAYFRKFHSNFKSKSTRLFRGMNPTVNKSQQLLFDSNFQSGNCDAVIKINQNQYDLFMRIDSNTRGHVQWFNFTVKNCGKKKVKFNIVNFKKAKTMYLRGMKPYIFSNHISQTKECTWIQGGENIKYQKKKLDYQFLQEYFAEDQLTYNCLSFQYQFQTDWQQVQFAYAPPFTYSDNLQMIKKLKQMEKTIMKNQRTVENILKQQIFCESLGGLEIHLLTITDFQVQDRNKKCVLVSARIHPGQPCGSYMMKGFLQFICSEKQQAKYLRKNIVFKVVPMLNVDGVTIGNFRTSLCGKDLNRTFKLNTDLLIPEVKALKDLSIKLRNQWKSRLIFFFDFHGHSVKKNVFLYGPQYQIWENGYYKTRIFPRLLADKTQLFRYYSCLFRIADFKRTTARAVLLKSIPHCYTIQASTGFFYSTEEKKDVPFTPQDYQFMGSKIAQTIKDYLQLLYDQQLSKQQKKQKLSEIKVLKSYRTGSKRQNQNKDSNKNKVQFKSNLPVQAVKKQQEKEDQKKQNSAGFVSKKARQMIQMIKKQEQQRKKQDGHQSDNFSEGGSDSQSENQDLSQQELNKLHQDILQSMKQFRQKIGGKDIRNQRQFSFKQEKTKKDIIKPKAKNIEVIASLRKKMEKMEKVKQTPNKIKEQFKLQKIHSKTDYKEGSKSSVNYDEQLQLKNKQDNQSKKYIQKRQSSSIAKSRLYSIIYNHEQIAKKTSNQSNIQQPTKENLDRMVKAQRINLNDMDHIRINIVNSNYPHFTKSLSYKNRNQINFQNGNFISHKSSFKIQSQILKRGE